MSSINILDHFFAEHLLGKEAESEKGIALTKLMAASRQGALCASKEKLSLAIDTLPASILEEGIELFPKTPVVHHQGFYYIQRNWVYETHIVQEVKRLYSQTSPTWLDKEKFEKELENLPLLPAQKNAICKASSRSFLVLCGGPGSGKTYTASYLIALLSAALKRSEKGSLRIMLAAPTGKAASHLHAAIQKRGVSEHLEATTLHRLLQLSPGQEKLFTHRPIDADVILVDEASMIDISLMAHLLESVGEETFLVLIGDPHQLPPVEGGSLFLEIAHLFGAYLDQCMRTEEQELQSMAHAVKMKDSETFFQLLSQEKKALSWVASLNKEDLFEWVQPFFSEEMPDPEAALASYHHRRILSPIRKGKEGIESLNAFLFEKVSSSKLYWAVPILAIANDSWTGIYNGMNGILIGKGREILTTWFPDPITGKMRSFSPEPPYEIAFCLSIHKSQGSEYEEVFALFPQGSESFGKEGLYTAITRARKKLWLCGSKETISEIIRTSVRTESNFTKRVSDALFLHSSEQLQQLGR
ncbi:MAG TPA: AAA family ATPase [Chlamydiales bacterium]|nr:AAA family ATPase [Chlamydiales bacterium]